MEIKKINDEIIIEWKYHVTILKNKKRKKDSDKTIPINQLSEDKLYVTKTPRSSFPVGLEKFLNLDKSELYFYKHFDDICITQQQPDDEVLYKKIRLNKRKAGKYENNENCNNIVTIPKKLFTFNDYDKDMQFVIRFFPNRCDYISNNQGLIMCNIQ